MQKIIANILIAVALLALSAVSGFLYARSIYVARIEQVSTAGLVKQAELSATIEEVTRSYEARLKAGAKEHKALKVEIEKELKDEKFTECVIGDDAMRLHENLRTNANRASGVDDEAVSAD